MNSSATSRLHLSAAALSFLATTLLAVPSAWAQDPLAPPETAEEEPTSPPAPVEGPTPQLGGLRVLGGGMFVDMGPMNDRLSDAGYSEELPALYPFVGGHGFGLFSRFLIGGSGAGLFPRSEDVAGNGESSASGAWGTFEQNPLAARRSPTRGGYAALSLGVGTW